MSNTPAYAPREDLSLEELKNLRVDTVLLSTEQPSEAQHLLGRRGISFSGNEPGTFIPSTDSSLTKDTLSQKHLDIIAIHSGDEWKYFKRVHVALPEDSPSGPPAAEKARQNGFRASLWKEVDKNGHSIIPGASMLRAYFPGFTFNAKELAAQQIVSSGGLNPQALGVPYFLDTGLAKATGPAQQMAALRIVGNSLGTQSGEVAALYAKAHGIAGGPAVLFEPYAANPNLIAAELKMPDSELTQAIGRPLPSSFIDELQKEPETVSPALFHSVRAFFRENGGNLAAASHVASFQVGGSPDNNAAPGRFSALTVSHHTDTHFLPAQPKKLQFSDIRKADLKHLSYHLTDEIYDEINHRLAHVTQVKTPSAIPKVEARGIPPTPGR